ncbi:GNAT family N-acetyltransferase [Sphingomonas sp. AR_OL41]|uniref:GNAT family N-acetyltransferase n=1 Tax=Sphingomonas sp. AR_OL41 TaxID=3042729 RepID=UPI0024816E3D|nr:GNAT family N-acetyltransferase [Sphingomonas sp. AR_OL41]MDH7974024.1 GNAT family N-acetyltransferase [Sphingomonas sp. AR_OL41]
MGGINLRKATRGDAAALGALHVASWREAYSGIMPDAMLAGISVEARTAMWDEVLGDPEAFGGTSVFVAEDSGRMVGFGSCGGQRDPALARAGFDGEITALYVLRSHQKRGVGRSIMSAMAERLSALGYSGLGLWVLRDNVPARAFYEGLDGTIVGEKSDKRFAGALVEVALGWSDLPDLRG